MIVTLKTPIRETPNLSPCVCLEPKKKNLTFFFFLFSSLLTSAAECTTLLSHSDTKVHTHAAFLYQTAFFFLIELETCFAWETRSLIEHESGVGWTPKGAVHPTRIS